LLSVLNEEAHEHDYHVQVRSYGLPDHGRTKLDVAAVNVEYGVDRTRFLLRWWGGEFPIETRLIGEFNVYNVLCAATTALTLNAPPTAVQAGIRAVSGVIGRMERIDRGQQFLAVVDFAHTPNSLERALQTLRPLVNPHADGSPGRLIAVFGSAGLRDRAKRGLMGRVSGELADFTVITAEDPRTEDLGAICADIAAGVREFTDEKHFAIVPDRSEAIQYAINLAQAGDVVGAFGKGNERSMCFGEIEHPWSDQDAMATALIQRFTK
jgi:UDP-N-acetylmuramoyl-L-alanyl-D-glutamate--2,6-diaminopimelate ligase